VYIDATRDNRIVSDTEDAGLDVEPVGFTARRKRTLIKNLITGVEAGESILPDTEPLVHELGVFEAETTASGNTRYGAPSGFEDDCGTPSPLRTRATRATASRRPGRGSEWQET